MKRTSTLKLVSSTGSRRYSMHDTFDFGMYKRYSVGLIYAFDPGYIRWCEKNIPDFMIYDFHEYEPYIDKEKQLNWQYRMIGDPSLIPDLEIFSNFQDYIDMRDGKW